MAELLMLLQLLLPMLLQLLLPMLLQLPAVNVLGLIAKLRFMAELQSCQLCCVTAPHHINGADHAHAPPQHNALNIVATLLCITLSPICQLCCVSPTHHINGADVMLLDGCHVLSVAANGEDATVNARVQRLHTSCNSSSSSSSSSSSVCIRYSIFAATLKRSPWCIQLLCNFGCAGHRHPCTTAK
jgi:hypothetical protein